MRFNTFYNTYKLIGGCIIFKVDRLLAFKIDRQLYNKRKFFINRELEQLNDDLYKTDIIGLQIYLDLVQSILLLYFNRCFIRSFINIFIDIFYGFDYDIYFDINISIVFI